MTALSKEEKILTVGAARELVDAIEVRQREIDRQQERIDLLSCALKFYAGESAHKNKYGGWSCNEDTPVNVDKGQMARAALALAQTA